MSGKTLSSIFRPLSWSRGHAASASAGGDGAGAQQGFSTAAAAGELEQHEEDDDNNEDEDEDEEHGGSTRGNTTSATTTTGSSNDAELSEERARQQGIVQFVCHIIKIARTRPKVFELNLSSGSIRQVTGGTRTKILRCSDIERVSLSADSCVTLEFHKSIGINKIKRYHFETNEGAASFQNYIEYRNEYGECIRSAFNFVDVKKTGHITKVTLYAALAAEDLQPSNEDIDAMFELASGRTDRAEINYYDFFHVYFGTPMHTVRSCLLEWLYQARLYVRNKSLHSGTGDAYVEQPAASLSAEGVRLLPGEEALATEPHLRWMMGSGRGAQEAATETSGTIQLTNYRIIFQSTRSITIGAAALSQRGSHSRHERPAYFEILNLPLNTITKIKLISVGLALQRKEIVITTKDLRIIHICLPSTDLNPSREDGLYQLVLRAAFPGSAADLFAFKMRCADKPEEWRYGDLRNEYHRLGLDSGHWAVFDNSDWSLCETYPQYLAVPKALSDAELREASAYRSRGRLPCATYRHAATGAVIARSAQPLVGLTQKSSRIDQALLSLYRLHGASSDPKEPELSSMFYIIDARRQIAATANKASGKGTEDVSDYRCTELVFCEIENIHAMRASFGSLLDISAPKDLKNRFAPTAGTVSGNLAAGLGLSGSASHQTHGHGAAAAAASASSSSSYSAVEAADDMWFHTNLTDSGWMRHISAILGAAVLTAEKVHLMGSSVLVHCSDGWDRTAQICSLAEVILDPYFRTLEGLAVLVEKEWCAFGHKFSERCGQGVDHSVAADERSNVFIQFLDALVQMYYQFPTAFEYNENAIVFLADHVFSGLFGNFLGNSDKERRSMLCVQSRSRSIWGYMFSDRRDAFANEKYRPFELPIWPKYAHRNLRFWQRYYCRWEPACHPNMLAEYIWEDDWGDKC